MPHKPKHRKKRKKPKKRKKMAEQVDTTLKVVVEATTRPQAGENQMANWTSGVEGWAAAKVTDLVATYAGAATLDNS
ncbi:hypothetical protein LCGC14_2430380, partial [marine sediment metagenome]